MCVFVLTFRLIGTFLKIIKRIIYLSHFYFFCCPCLCVFVIFTTSSFTHANPPTQPLLIELNKNKVGASSKKEVKNIHLWCPKTTQPPFDLTQEAFTPNFICLL